jgi:hypothetical protein
MNLRGATSTKCISEGVKDENGDLLANSHILNRWKDYFSVIECALCE